jgi:trehalose-6-phosphate synthase
MNRDLAKRLVIVANRLPLAIERTDKNYQIGPASGGLAQSLTPILRQQGRLWIGSAGTYEDARLNDQLAAYQRQAKFAVKPVYLSREEQEKFYDGFSHEIIWPLFHDLQSQCDFFDAEYWHYFEKVNGKFAEATAQSVQAEDFIWVQDYHLMNVARELRARNITNPIGFFLHIPFPAADIFMKLPWRAGAAQVSAGVRSDWLSNSA